MAIHVYPTDDWIDHRVDGEEEISCPCDPDVQWIDDKTGLPLDEPVIIHTALDGRE